MYSDSEDFIVSDEYKKDVLCPIGRNIMKNPEKSRACVHVFEKENLSKKNRKFI